MVRGVVRSALAGLVGLALGCGSLDVASEEHERESLSDKEQGAKQVLPFPSEKAWVHAKVLADLKGPGDGPLKVVLGIAEDPVSAAEYTGGEYGEATLEANGLLTNASLNGVPIDNHGLADASEKLREGLAQAWQVAEERRRGRWKELAATLGTDEEMFSAVIGSGAASAELTLPREVVAKAGSVSSSLLASVEPWAPGVMNQAAYPMVDVLGTIDITTVAFPGGWDGTNIGIYSCDIGDLDTSHPCLNTQTSFLKVYPPPPGTPYHDHAWKMVCSIQPTAPKARVYYSTRVANCGTGFPSPAIPAGATSPIVWISHQSISYDAGTSYTTCSRDFDNQVMLTRIAHFNSTGNDGSYAANPSIGFNVFGIGATHTGPSPRTMWPSSNYLNPVTQVEKPDVVVPGETVLLASGNIVGGTSTSAAISAGFAADLMEQMASFRGRPALLRSFLLANANRIGGGSAIYGSQDGFGELDYSNAQYGNFNWWDGPGNTSFFNQDLDGDGLMEIVVNRTVSTTGTYHAVIAWLADGTFGHLHQRAHMDLDLRVIGPTGNFVAISTGSRRNVEALKFNATTTGTYKVVIEKVRTYGPGDLVLGLTFRKR